MKIRKHQIHFFIILFTISILSITGMYAYALFDVTSVGEIENEQEVIPETIMDPEPDMDKVTCGDGTILKDDMCIAKGWSFFDFFKDFMKFFN